MGHDLARWVLRSTPRSRATIAQPSCSASAKKAAACCLDRESRSRLATTSPTFSVNTKTPWLRAQATNVPSIGQVEADQMALSSPGAAIAAMLRSYLGDTLQPLEQLRLLREELLFRDDAIVPQLA